MHEWYVLAHWVCVLWKDLHYIWNKNHPLLLLLLNIMCSHHQGYVPALVFELSWLRKGFNFSLPLRLWLFWDHCGVKYFTVFFCFVRRLWWLDFLICTQQWTSFWTYTSCCLPAATIWPLTSLTWKRMARVKGQSRAQWESFCPWQGAWYPQGRHELCTGCVHLMADL